MVYILLAPGFEEIEALAPADLLRRAGIETALVSVTGEPVPGSHGITVTADVTLDEVDLSKMDMVVLPGGGPGYKNLGKVPRVEALVREAVKRDIWVAAICAAPSVLGAAGILDGKHAVCHPGFEEKLTGAIVSEDTVMTDGTVITSRGMGTAIDFALAIVSYLKDDAAVSDLKQKLVYT